MKVTIPYTPRKQQAFIHTELDKHRFSVLCCHRRFGKTVMLINHLIKEAKKLGIKRLSIETGAGKFFEPARKLFHKSKFEPCGPFAHYKEDKNSIYLTKLISND